MNAIFVFIYHSLYLLGYAVCNAHTNHIYTTYLPCLVSILLLFQLSSVDHLSRIMFGYCSKYEHSLIPNVLAIFLQLTMIRKTGMHDSPRYTKRMEFVSSPFC